MSSVLSSLRKKNDTPTIFSYKAESLYILRFSAFLYPSIWCRLFCCRLFYDFRRQKSPIPPHLWRLQPTNPACPRHKKWTSIPHHRSPSTHPASSSTSSGIWAMTPNTSSQPTGTCSIGPEGKRPKGKEVTDERIETTLIFQFSGFSGFPIRYVQMQTTTNLFITICISVCYIYYH